MLSPHAGSASSQCVISAPGPSGLKSNGCRRRSRDGKNRGLSGYGSPARPGAELQSLEEETQSQAEPKEAVEEAAEETAAEETAVEEAAEEAAAEEAADAE